MSTKYSIVLTTYAKEETGEKLINSLLSAKLAACVQVMPIRSCYTWKGAVAKDSEQLMLVKMKSSDFEAVKDCILRNHDYEIPEILQLDIANGFSGYLNWIDEVTV